MPDIRNLTKTRLSLPHEDGTVVIPPEGKVHVSRVTAVVLKAVENGLIEVLGAVKQKLSFPINDLLPHEAVAAVDSLQDVDLLRSLLEEAKNKKVQEAIKRRLKLLEEPMTQVSDILLMLRTDLGDTAGELLGDNDVLRALTRAILAVDRDIGRVYQITGNEIVPDLTGDDADLVVLRAHAFCCSMLRSAASANFSFGSGDKRVDKTMQAQAWADLEKDLLDRYREAVSRINPSLSDGLLDPGNVRPKIFEVGRRCR